MFDIRSVVGAKLSKVLADNNTTKAGLSKSTGVSRPTIDKLLEGNLTSKKNFENHIIKILSYIGITPDQLLDNVADVNNRTRIFRNMMKISINEISKSTGITRERLGKIESGEEATIAELRDIALYLSIGVKDLKGENFFEPQIVLLDDFVRLIKSDEIKEISGFWGHVGIMLNNTSEYLWYPITSKTRAYINKMIENERLVVPCMNNKVLYLNMSNIKEILLLDEACDQPSYSNWDTDVSCGEIPLVIFEALEDYIMLQESEEEYDNISKKFGKVLNEIIKDHNWSEEDIEEMIYVSKIYYADGKVRCADIEFDDAESLTNEIMEAYCFEDSTVSENMVFFRDTNETEIFINVKQISMIELPLLEVEKSISSIWKDMGYDLENS